MEHTAKYVDILEQETFRQLFYAEAFGIVNPAASLMSGMCNFLYERPNVHLCERVFTYCHNVEGHLLTLLLSQYEPKDWRQFNDS